MNYSPIPPNDYPPEWDEDDAEYERERNRRRFGGDDCE